MKKILATIIIIALIACMLSACSLTDFFDNLNGDDGNNDGLWVAIDSNDVVEIGINETVTFEATRHNDVTGFYSWAIDDSDVADIDSTMSRCHVTGKKIGVATLTLRVGEYSDTITISVVDKTVYDEEATITLSIDSDEIYVNGVAVLSYGVTPDKYQHSVQYRVTSGQDCVQIIGNGVKGIAGGIATIVAYVGEWTSNTVTIQVLKDDNVDPYIGVSRVDFYASYTPATSYKDAQNRAKHGFMAGDIVTPVAAPTIASNRPMEDGMYLRNTTSIYEDGGNTYVVLDENGEVVKRIYKGGGYITLEDVAAYVLAFNDIPANYDEDKSPSVTQSIWGKYLRANHSKFNGSTTKYPYEPELPNISGCGGSYQYMEMDIGTTGTDTGGGYAVREYNNGSSITRGAARIVHTSYDKNGSGEIDVDERYVFYTYNHYNDFQEYLNYYNGWGEMFGNITGGGTLSSKTDYNPTPYVKTKKKDFASESRTVKFRVVEYFVIPSKDDEIAA